MLLDDKKAEIYGAALSFNDELIKLGAALGSIKDEKTRKLAMDLALGVIINSEDTPHPSNSDPIYELMRLIKFGSRRLHTAVFIDKDGRLMVAVPDFQGPRSNQSLLDGYAEHYALERNGMRVVFLDQIPEPKEPSVTGPKIRVGSVVKVNQPEGEVELTIQIIDEPLTMDYPAENRKVTRRLCAAIGSDGFPVPMFDTDITKVVKY